MRKGEKVMRFFSRMQTYLQQLKDCGRENVIDVIWCGVRYGASPNNYRDFNFAQLNGKQRASYVTNRISEKMIRAFNNPKYTDIFEDKTKFAERFSKYFKREWISTDRLSYEDFLKFIEGKEKIIYKPIGNAQGRGIVVYDDLSSPKQVYDCVIQDQAILEEWIQQHPVFNHVYGDAVNCLRIITVYYKGKVNFLAGGVTWADGSKISNACVGGLVSTVDMSTGILSEFCADYNGNKCKYHPISNANVSRLQIPFWHETIEMVKAAATEIPEMGYIGWDIAITPTGPVIIEGNTTPGYRYYQMPALMKNGMGNRAVYEECLK